LRGDGATCRDVQRFSTGAIATFFSCEFFVSSAMQAVVPLKQLLQSNHPNARRLTEHMLKTTAASIGRCFRISEIWNVWWKVRLVSKDSHEDDKKKDDNKLFDVYVSPTSKFLRVEGHNERLKPGMTVTTEIKVGKRRIVELLNSFFHIYECWSWGTRPFCQQALARYRILRHSKNYIYPPVHQLMIGSKC
jgi:hypothetical protein